MNFTFTWILDKFGFQPKIELIKPVAKKTTRVAKKTTKSTVPKATTRTKK
jgi:hypothetical protein